MGDWSDNLPYEQREYAGHFYDTDEDTHEEEELYCTECPYFEFTGEPTDEWYGARCKKDNHKASPSMIAIQSLNDDCPIKAEKGGE